jgi:D-alanyl-D-alanine dipeptidase
LTPGEETCNVARMRGRAEPSPQIAQELTQFFTDLNDEAKLTAYHADPAGYVQAQQDQGVLSAAAAAMILGQDPVIESTVRPAGGTSTARVVFPP